MRILFVCLGNICRSPMAEGMFRNQADERGLLDAVDIDSAGTIDWHSGRPPDPRAQSAAARRGSDISALRSRLCVPADLERFDLILAVDAPNFEQVLRMATEEQRPKVRMLLDFSPYASDRGREVPDPFDEGLEGFEHALDLISLAMGGLADYVSEMSGKVSSTR